MSEKTLKYMEIFQCFKQKILSKEIVPGEQMPAESSIVRDFGVSRHTVRQAFSELEKAGYIYREKCRGTFCSDISVNIKNSTRTIAIITTYISDYIFPSIIRGTEEVLSENGYTLLLFSTNNEKEKEAEALKKILNYNVDGVIIEPTASAMDNTNIELYRELDKKRIPYIMINAKYDELKPAYIIMDDVKGGYITTNYLINKGHKNIAGIFKEDDIQGLNRKEGYLRSLEENNIEINRMNIGSFRTYEEKFYPSAFIRSILANPKNRPTAVVCYNDTIAVEVLQVARELGINVPNQLSIMGYDDSNLSTATELKITTVTHPKEDMGRLAAKTIIDMIENNREKINYVYTPEILERDSVKSM